MTNIYVYYIYMYISKTMLKYGKQKRFYFFLTYLSIY